MEKSIYKFIGTAFMYILVTIAFAMVVLFPALLFSLPVAEVITADSPCLPLSQIHSGFLYQIRTVCKIE